MFYLYDYVPKKYISDDSLKEKYINIRNNIWNFKNGYSSSHSIFSSDIIDRVNDLKEIYPNRELVFVPIPASNPIDTTNRFLNFCSHISTKCDIINGFNFVECDTSSPAHLGGNRSKNFYLNSSMSVADDSIIILFDDIVTSGRSSNSVANLFSNNIIEYIFLGKTIDRYDVDFYKR